MKKNENYKQKYDSVKLLYNSMSTLSLSKEEAKTMDKVSFEDLLHPIKGQIKGKYIRENFDMLKTIYGEEIVALKLVNEIYFGFLNIKCNRDLSVLELLGDLAPIEKYLDEKIKHILSVIFKLYLRLKEYSLERKAIKPSLENNVLVGNSCIFPLLLEHFDYFVIDFTLPNRELFSNLAEQIKVRF